MPPRPLRLRVLSSPDLSLPLASLRRVGRARHTVRFLPVPVQSACLQEPVEISMASPKFRYPEFRSTLLFAALIVSTSSHFNRALDSLVSVLETTSRIARKYGSGKR